MKNCAIVIVAGSVLAACSGPMSGDVSEEAINSTLVQTAVAAEESTDYEAAVGHFAKLHDKNPKDLGFLLGLARNLRYIGSAKKPWM